MLDVIHKFSRALDMIKGFETGHTSENHKQMIVNVEGVSVSNIR